MAYLSYRPDAHLGQLRIAPLRIDPATGEPSAGDGGPVLAGDCLRTALAPSADGRWLLYQNGHRIEVVAAQGGQPKDLVQGDYPAWGARSSSIVFTSGLPGKSRTLWTAPFSVTHGELSGSPKPLTFGRGSDLGAAVSRDGATMAFSAMDETLNLESIPFDAEAGRVLGAGHDLTAGDNRIGFFDPSPDGKTVVFDQDRGAGSHLWRIDPPAPAVELTLERRKLWSGNPNELYRVACDLVLAADLSREAPERSKYNDLALETLRQALKAGYRDLNKLRNNPDLESLRAHPEFGKLLKEFDKGESH